MVKDTVTKRKSALPNKGVSVWDMRHKSAL